MMFLSTWADFLAEKSAHVRLFVIYGQLALRRPERKPRAHEEHTY